MVDKEYSSFKILIRKPKSWTLQCPRTAESEFSVFMFEYLNEIETNGVEKEKKDKMYLTLTDYQEYNILR